MEPLVHSMRFSSTLLSITSDPNLHHSLRIFRLALGPKPWSNPCWPCENTPGDRTLVDALEPFISTLSRTGNVEKAAQAAEDGTQKTKLMKASLGRSVYIGGQIWQDVPDPGAYGLSQFFLGLAQGLK